MLRINIAAAKDIRKAKDWYAQKSLGLGVVFLKHLNFHFKKIETYPSQYMFVNKRVQRCQLKRFPYKIYFTVKNDDIIILRLRHNKQKPLKRFT